ncbi:MAG: DUF4224 domain-containing protein [Candidatus Thiodiazotropha lotti]|nr:DUF4224 domain-containing protein [Candidatus Thiodiazotropha lotti]MCG8004619.1 DUF4224 domain-containing protein [Candidatus Thiodiazotropha lotti]MCG8006637.1 DUF4224 domain-containing protein [Candidatus Thiodiazotropha lotti]MCW4188246.1 DUF4224 domain-containing protein [Candidatus Thiodiazotropha lotti]MCW4194219.1 DUF4224 domain-containing protein [Candidatus Thiodiazotropha lotti]
MKNSQSEMLVPLDVLKELTGYSRKNTMIRWLIENGWRFVIASNGWPKVAVEEFNRHMVGNSKSVSKKRVPRLRLEAIK